MAILNIRLYPDPILRKVCDEVEKVDKNIQTLINNMIETMKVAPGVGLSAPQVGVICRIIVFENKSSATMALVNPQILSSDGNISEEEGCLSIPDIFAKVKRSGKIHVKGLDRSGRELVFDADGATARVIQHEIDHLDGFLFLDRLGAVKRGILKRKIKRMLSQR